MAFDLDKEELAATKKLHKCDKSIKGTGLIIRGVNDKIRKCSMCRII